MVEIILLYIIIVIGAAALSNFLFNEFKVINRDKYLSLSYKNVVSLLEEISQALRGRESQYHIDRVEAFTDSFLSDYYIEFSDSDNHYLMGLKNRGNNIRTVALYRKGDDESQIYVHVDDTGNIRKEFLMVKNLCDRWIESLKEKYD